MADSYFEIGKTHTVCQDYALSGSIGDSEYVVVADGCSSADYSEIGAQVLCHAARYQIELCYQTGLFQECNLKTLSLVLGNSIYKRIDEVRKIYPISQKALEATLLIAVKVGSKILVWVWGDGVIIANYKYIDGSYYQKVVKIDYSLNAPFYLISDEKRYLKGCKDKGEDSPQVIHTTYTLLENGLKEDIVESVHHFSLPYIDIYSGLEGIDRLCSVTICSDGVSSYRDVNKEDVDLNVIIPELISFKNTTGEFVKKRMFFFNKKVVKNEWSHYDDVGCGTIYLNRVET